MTQLDRAGEAYQMHLPAAQALAAEDIRPYRLDPDVAIINVNRAIGVLEPLRAEIPVHLPRIDLPALDALPSLALAVKTAALAAENPNPSGISPSEMIAEGWQLRGKLLPVVGGFAAMGLIPDKVYKKIVQGGGVRDMANDCVDLARVFRDYQAAIAGKHPVEPGMIQRTEEVGTWLSQNLSKRTAAQPETKTAEVDIRDRLATLLMNRYDRLRAVAYYFHGDAFAEYVPPLMSRRTTRAADSEPEPEPEPEPVSEPEPASKPEPEPAL